MQVEKSAPLTFTPPPLLPDRTTRPAWHTPQFRWLGVIPLLIFLWRLLQCISVNTPGWILSSCHVSTLALAVAMIFGWPMILRITVIWLVIGLPMWLIDAYVTQVIWLASVVSHVSGFLLAIYVIRQVRATGRTWFPALLWFLCLQMITRYTTAPELNVNFAHFPYEPFKAGYSHYWSFWLVCTTVVALMVGVVELSLVKLYPVISEGESHVQTYASFISQSYAARSECSDANTGDA